jgi:Protein of unknown function with HXXEE motif
MATSPATVPKQVTWGLLGAWAAHDLEELATMAPSSRRIVARLRSRYPRIPGGVWERLEVSPAHVAVAIGLMGTVMTAAAAVGARSGGRSGFYQAVLAGFGWHAVGHVAQAIAVGGYAPGVVTAPVLAALPPARVLDVAAGRGGPGRARLFQCLGDGAVARDAGRRPLRRAPAHPAHRRGRRRALAVALTRQDRLGAAARPS